ncbi:hypothetical protein [Glycomyces xiaoerkulensis]|nr:hypothetical protein [Glycomyces xiaoerkulensis]
MCDGLLRVLLAQVDGCFARVGPRLKAGQYLRAVTSGLAERQWLVDR